MRGGDAFSANSLTGGFPLLPAYLALLLHSATPACLHCLQISIPAWNRQEGSWVDGSHPLPASCTAGHCTAPPSPAVGATCTCRRTPSGGASHCLMPHASWACTFACLPASSQVWEVTCCTFGPLLHCCSFGPAHRRRLLNTPAGAGTRTDCFVFYHGIGPLLWNTATTHIRLYLLLCAYLPPFYTTLRCIYPHLTVHLP